MCFIKYKFLIQLKKSNENSLIQQMFYFYINTGLQYQSKNFVGEILYANMMKNNNQIIISFLFMISLVFLSQSCNNSCADCSEDNIICFACLPGYELSVAGKCIIESTIPKCYLYGPSNSCFLCQPSYRLQNDKCVKDYSACINMNLADGSCFQCGFGTILQDGKCVGTINCAQPENKCSQCRPGFVQKNEKCYPLQGCNSFDQSSGVCKQCSSSYQLVGYNCISSNKKAYDCYIYNQNQQCQSCKNGYISYERQCLLPFDINKIQDGQLTMNDLIASKKKLYDAIINSSAASSELPAIALIENCQVVNPQDKSKCIICVYGLYPSSDGAKSCIKVSELCDGHDVSNGNCFSCKFGLTLNAGKCVDINCQAYQEQTCSKCKQYFSFNQNKVCVYTDSNCQIKDTKKCIVCNENYKINSQGYCQINNQILKIANCKIVDQVNKICALCQDRFYRSKNQCLIVNTICKDYDMSDGKCKSCIDGYTFTNNQCIKILITVQNQTNTINNNTSSAQNNSTETGGGAITINNNNNTTQKDQNCLKFLSGKCTQCSNRFYVSSADGKCVPVNPLCQKYDQFGYCTSCYIGYKVQNKICVAAQQKDPYCRQTDIQGICKSCFNGFFLNSIKFTCEPLNPLCKFSDLSNGKCTSCYQGYTLSQGTCKVFVRDPNCQQYDINNNCLKCSLRFFLFQGLCKQVSPLCRESDKITGECTSCFPGYVLIKGQCKTATAQTDDINCQKKENDTCVSCYDGYYLNSNTKKCTAQNLICKTIFLNNGSCQTCYEGYSLRNDNCVISSEQTTDVQCNKFNPINNKICLQCYQGYFVTSSGLCNQIDPLCKKSDNSTGSCSDCYSGYNLVNGKCILVSQDNSTNSYPFCIKIQGTKCIQCNKGYFLPSSNLCTQVDATCKTYAMQNGTCLTCFQNFVLLGGKCIVGQQIYIPFCKQVNTQGKCAECIDRYYLNKQSCSPVNILCQGFNKLTGKCATCISGYVLQVDQCIFPALGVDQYCAYYTNSYCTECKSGYFLLNYFCTQVDKKCLQFSYERNICTKCFNSTPQGPYCV